MPESNQYRIQCCILMFYISATEAYIYNPYPSLFGSQAASKCTQRQQYRIHLTASNEDNLNMKAKEKAASTSMHVEGLNFDDREDEILAMGGDPFFLDDDEFIDVDDDDDELTLPSMSLMSSISSLPKVIDYVEKKMDSSKEIENDLNTSSLKSDQKSSMEVLEQQKEELIELGGDPFFLDDDDDAEVTNNNLLDEWDGWPIEDAHEDFY